VVYPITFFIGFQASKVVQDFFHPPGFKNGFNGIQNKYKTLIPMGDLQDPKMEVPTIYKAYIRPM